MFPAIRIIQESIHRNRRTKVMKKMIVTQMKINSITGLRKNFSDYKGGIFYAV